MKNIILSSINQEELVHLISLAVENIILKYKELENTETVLKKELGDYLTKKEVADLCKVKSLTTLWNWEQKGKLVPKRKAGKKPLYSRQDVEAFLNRDNQNSNDKAA